MKVTVDEIIDALLECQDYPLTAIAIGQQIKQHGIAPPDGYVLISRELLDDTCELLELLGLHGDDCYQAIKAMLSAVKE